MGSDPLPGGHDGFDHPAGLATLPHERITFAHPSERQVARLLDFYGIEWSYEPVTFVLERDRVGHPTHAFSPDFYLPRFDLFVEITTQRQKLVTKKNRKVRRLREQYPEINIRVLYQRDCLALLMKFGLEAPSELPPRPVDADGGAEVDAGEGMSFLTPPARSA